MVRIEALIMIQVLNTLVLYSSKLGCQSFISVLSSAATVLESGDHLLTSCLFAFAELPFQGFLLLLDILTQVGRNIHGIFTLIQVFYFIWVIV